MDSDAQPTLGLRERKKAKTRAAIQRHALRLFRDQGYHATTVEQIAQAAEISPSTFFRYFPTKEDVVLNDEYDSRMIEAFHAQPADLSPMQALRQAMSSALQNMSPDELASEQERSQLIFSIPEVRATFWNNMAQTLRMLSNMLAKRVGRDPDDLAVHVFAGALFGVGMSVSFRCMERQEKDFYTEFSKALALLEDGMPL